MQAERAAVFAADQRVRIDRDGRQERWLGSFEHAAAIA
jgi:hypothetical protein